MESCRLATMTALRETDCAEPGLVAKMKHLRDEINNGSQHERKDFLIWIRVVLLLATCTLSPLLSEAQSTPLDVFLLIDNSSRMWQYDSRLSLPGALLTFATRLPANSQLGILIFDKDVTGVLELTRTDSKRFEGDVSEALRKVNYTGSRSNLAAGIERAIVELRQHGRSDAKRAVVFVSDGILHLGSGQTTNKSSSWLPEDLALEAKHLGISVFPVILNQAADYRMVLGFARTTGGEYFRALAPSLPRALEQVDEILAKNVESVPAVPESPQDPPFRRRGLMVGVVVIALAVAMLVAVFAWRRHSRGKAPRPELLRIAIEEPSSNLSLSALRERGAIVSRELFNATAVLNRTNSSVNQLQAAVERYVLSNYNAVQEVEEQCVSLGRECILLLDHLDIMIHRTEEESQQADSLRSARARLCNLLEGAKIEEIPVKAGDVFDSAVQVATSTVANGSREGLVVAVSRKGYEMKVRGRDVILRPAEVTVTSMHAETQAEGARNETKARY
jgi:molecular chaperone GrpE (heat shock protein)